MPDMGNLWKPESASLDNTTNFKTQSQNQAQNQDELYLYPVEIKTLGLEPYSDLDQIFSLPVSNFNTDFSFPNSISKPNAFENNTNLKTQPQNQLHLYPLEIKTLDLEPHSNLDQTFSLPVSNFNTHTDITNSIFKPNASNNNNTNLNTQPEAQDQNQLNLYPTEIKTLDLAPYSNLVHKYSLPVSNTDNTKMETQAQNQNQNQNQNELNLYPVEIKTQGLENYSNLDQTFSVPVSNFLSHDITYASDSAFGIIPNNSISISISISKPNGFLPFQVSAPKMIECHSCQKMIYHGEEVFCSVRDCSRVFHLSCIKEKQSLSTMKLKCPQHGVVRLNNQCGQVICWRHPTNWRMEKKLDIPASNIEEILCHLPLPSIEEEFKIDFSLTELADKQHDIPASDIKEILCHLPLPYIEEEFKIDFTWTEPTDNKWEPPSYDHIRRNLYLIKKKRSDVDDDTGCTSCSSEECSVDCVCRVQCISCSKACRCSDMCTNRPFRKEKKISLVKTELCGWGVEAAVSINEGEFVIEYVGEVIDDAICTQRLWDMKYKCTKNFYLCEIEKNFIIDSTYKGNCSRFLNHSCQPNCKLEKWQVDGETRVGVFAARPIRVGEPLTYDYRFVQFGQEVKCCCGAPNCQGYLGTKKKVNKIEVGWGLKRKRTPTLSCLLRTSYI